MKTSISLFFACLCGLPLLSAQISLKNPKLIEGIRNSITFVIKEDLGDNEAELEAYKQVFEENWTISKVVFISREKWDKIPPEDRFKYGYTLIHIDGINRIQGRTSSGDGRLVMTPEGLRNDQLSSHPANDKRIEYTYLKVSHFSTKEKDVFAEPERVIRLDLMVRYEEEPEDLYWNWGPGICKNYLQYLMQLMEEGKKVSLYGGKTEADEVKKLATDTLYVPDYLAYKFDRNTWSERPEHDLEKLFKNYSHPWKVVSVAELNEKILQAEKPFYYLLYVMATGERYINVMNAATGDIIYQKYTANSYNLKPSTISNLGSAISAESR